MAEILPQTIRRTSDRVNFGGARVLLRELPSVGGAEAPAGINHFWLGYRPPEEPGRMMVEYKNPNFTHVADHSLLFMAPGTRFTCEWKGAEGVVMHVQFRPAFLEEVAVSSRVDAKHLHQSAMQEIMLDEALAGLCRVLMREVDTGCRCGSAFFEAVSRALALALVQRLGLACPSLTRDERVAKAISFIEQHFQERVSLNAVARAACLSPYYFSRRFRAVVGISPHAYLVQCRLRHAQHLIAANAGNRTLTHVAVEAGFYDQAHLTWHFRRAFGDTPKHWLRQQ
jgi:AraC-like DNA-binding protein